jgi:hypothetical protein
MTFDFSRVNWLYIGLAAAFWLICVLSMWHRPNGTMGEQYREFNRSHPDARLSYDEWAKLAPPGHGAPVPPGRKEPIILWSAF